MCSLVFVAVCALVGGKPASRVHLQRIRPPVQKKIFTAARLAKSILKLSIPSKSTRWRPRHVACLPKKFLSASSLKMPSFHLKHLSKITMGNNVSMHVLPTPLRTACGCLNTNVQSMTVTIMVVKSAMVINTVIYMRMARTLRTLLALRDRNPGVNLRGQGSPNLKLGHPLLVLD